MCQKNGDSKALCLIHQGAENPNMGCSSDDATAAPVRQEALTRAPQNHGEDAVPLLCCQEDPASCVPGYFPHSRHVQVHTAS